jgi:alpha-glucan phosphorylase-like protein
MSVLAANLSCYMNGVSRLHGKVSQEMFAPLYKGYFPEETHINYVTNGVHYYTWTHKKLRQLYENTFGEGFLHDQSNPDYWRKIHHVSDKDLWSIKQSLKTELIDYLKKRFLSGKSSQHENPRHLLDIVENLDDKALVIGFARRFATYKRGNLLFRNLDRLAQIVNDPERPVRILIAGKGTSHDGGGQDLIKQMFRCRGCHSLLAKLFLSKIMISNWPSAWWPEWMCGSIPLPEQWKLREPARKLP